MEPSAFEFQSVRFIDELVISCGPVGFFLGPCPCDDSVVSFSETVSFLASAIRFIDELVISCRPVGFLGPYPCDDSLVSFNETVSFLGLGRQDH